MTNWFQTEECYNFYKSLSFLEPFKFEVKRDGEVKGRIIGYIQKDGGKLKQFFSRRAIINGGPMLADDITPEELSELLGFLKEYLRGKAIYVETRNFKDYSKYKDIFERNNFRYQQHYDILIDTSDFDSVYQKMDRNRKRNINKAIEKGITAEYHPSDQDVKIFYKLLCKLYSEKVKAPLVPFSFFDKLHKSSFANYIVIKTIEGNIISGIVCVGTGPTLYALYACGRDAEYRELSPSVMANYEAIKYACENGYTCFDFMGAGAPGDGGYGVRDFKAKFGGELVEYGRFKFIINRPLYLIGTLGVSLIKKMK